MYYFERYQNFVYNNFSFFLNKDIKYNFFLFNIVNINSTLI